jgi:transformation/transcription domain-associated protein
LPTLLEEKVLVGTGRACHAVLRPQAYSMLAELIHHMRMDLTHAQLGQIIYLFSRNLHDASLPVSSLGDAESSLGDVKSSLGDAKSSLGDAESSLGDAKSSRGDAKSSLGDAKGSRGGIQVTLHIISFRLMLTLVDCIYQRRHESNEGRALLGKITEAFMQRLGTLKRAVPKMLKIIKKKADDDAAAAKAKAAMALALTQPGGAEALKAEEADDKEKDADGDTQEAVNPAVAAAHKRNVLYLKAGVEVMKEVNDCKHLLKTIVLGMKTLVWSITNYNRPNDPAPGQPEPVPRGPKGLTHEEVRMTSRLLTSGLTCLRLYFDAGDGDDILEAFGGVFTVMVHRNFLDLVNMQVCASPEY